MNRAVWLALLTVAAAVVAASTGELPPAPPAGALTVIYTGAAFGKLTPCACTPESDIGGILRRDTALLPLRQQYPQALQLEAGGSFDTPSAQSRLGALAYIRSLRAIGYEAAAVGPTDLVYGEEFLAENGGGLFFASNLTWKKRVSPLAQPVRVVERNGVAIELVAIVEPDDIGPGDRVNVTAAPPGPFLDQHCAPDRLTIVLCSTSREKAQALLAHPRVEVVINAFAASDVIPEPRYSFAGGKVLAEGGVYGSRIGVLQLTWAAGALTAAQNQYVPLTKQYADGQRALPFYNEYQAEVKKAFLARLAGRPPFDRAASPYAGAESCRECHARAFKKWQSTKHPQAWEALKKVKKDFDPECIVCHTIGFEQPGGFVSEQDSPHLAGVGCEACHGPAKKHVEAKRGFIKKPTLEVCRRCHTPEAAPGFQPRKYWRKIRH